MRWAKGRIDSKKPRRVPYVRLSGLTVRTQSAEMQSHFLRTTIVARGGLELFHPGRSTCQARMPDVRHYPIRSLPTQVRSTSGTVILPSAFW